MESVAHRDHVLYQSIPSPPGNTASSAQFSNEQVRLNANSAPLFRRLRSLLALVVVLSISAFVASRTGLIERHTRSRVSHFYPAWSPKLHFARHIGLTNYGVLSSPSRRSYAKRVNPYSSIFKSFVHNDASAVEDFVLDEMVPTGQCSARTKCRARLTVVKNGSQVVIKAGYYIYTQDGIIRSVDGGTKSRLTGTTHAQALQWATELLEGASARLAQVNATIIVEEIAEAILDGRDVVLTCAETGDPRCDATEVIQEYTIAEAKQVDPCTDFVKSTAGVKTLAELQSECPTAEFYYNRVGVSLPVCITECSSNPGVDHAVYMDFYVQSNPLSANKADCVSASVVAAYQYFLSSLPACDSVSSGNVYERRYIASLASKYDDTVPEELKDFAQLHGCELTYAFISGLGNSFESVVDASCAAS